MSLRSRLSRLIPEVRTDKNGVMSIRWVRPEDEAKQPSKSLPAPALPATPVQTPEPLQEQPEGRPWITGMASRLRAAATPAEVENVRDLLFRLAATNENQRALLDEVLDVLANEDDSPSAVHERRITGILLDALVTGDEYDPNEVLYALAVRQAFCSELSRQTAREGLQARHLMPFVKGAPITNTDTPEKLAKAVAGVRFAYELTNHFFHPNEEYAPTLHGKVNSGPKGYNNSAFIYKDAELLFLVMEKADQIDEMIELYRDHRIMDVRTLRIRLENPELPMPLTDGML